MTTQMKAKRLFGGILLVYFVCQVIWTIAAWIGEYGNFKYIDSIREYFLDVPFSERFEPLILLAILAVSFFMKDDKTQKLLVGLSFFGGCLVELVTFQQRFFNNYRTSYGLVALFYLFAYGFVGYLVLSKKSNNKMTIVVILSLAALPVFSNCVEYALCRIIIVSYDNILTSLYRWSIFGYFELVIVALGMLSSDFLSKYDAQKGIVIRPDLISFSDLLLFVENEYSQGKLTEQEYNAKRNEILRNL